MIRAVIFDLDGTLVEANIDFKGMREDIKKVFKRYNLIFDHEKLILENIEDARKKFKDEMFLKEVNEIIEGYELGSIRDKKKIKGIDEKLREIRGEGIRIFVLTRSGKKYCREVMKIFPKDIFDEVITRDDFPTAKPDSGPILHIMEKYNLRNDEIIMVGDHPIDIVSAKNLGIKCIGVLSGYCNKELLERANADMIVESAADIDIKTWDDKNADKKKE